MDLRERYRSMQSSGVSLAPAGAERSAAVSRGAGHGSSSLSQLVPLGRDFEAKWAEAGRAAAAAARRSSRNAAPRHRTVMELLAQAEAAGASDAEASEALDSADPRRALKALLQAGLRGRLGPPQHARSKPHAADPAAALGAAATSQAGAAKAGAVRWPPRAWRGLLAQAEAAGASQAAVEVG
jgi:hypothetical protein